MGELDPQVGQRVSMEIWNAVKLVPNFFESRFNLLVSPPVHIKLNSFVGLFSHGLHTSSFTNPVSP